MNNARIPLPFGPAGPRTVTMRGPADMAELLPYLLGFYPDDSIVAVGLQGRDLHQGGVIRLDLPDSPGEWPAAADEAAALLVGLSERRDQRPAQVLLYLCQDPGPDPGTTHGPPVRERLGPLAAELRTAFEHRGVAVKESLCVSAGRWWSFLCRREGCCDPAGHPVRHAPGPGPVAVAATVAGLAPRGSRKSIVAGLTPIGPPGADAQRRALARAERAMGAGRGRPRAEQRGAALLDQAVAEFATGTGELDELRVARLLVALQDRRVRDRAAEYARPAELAPAQRLWRYLARRCVPPYTGYASPPLTLLAWVSWVAGDTATARVVLAHTLRRDPSYLLAQLLYESLNAGLSPAPLLARADAERRRRNSPARGGPGAAGASAAESGEAGGTAEDGGPDADPAPSAAPVPADGPGPGGSGPGSPAGAAEPERDEGPAAGPGADPAGGPDGPRGAGSARARRRRARRETTAPPVPGAPGAPDPGQTPGPVLPPSRRPAGGAPGGGSALTGLMSEKGVGRAEGPVEGEGGGRTGGGAATGPPSRRGVLPGRRPPAPAKPGRGLRLGRPSPWAVGALAPALPAGGRGRCHGVRGPAIGPRHAQ
ncbi:DUF4192 domain-containing protein [Kitasatospora sp. CM 4170]|uniref:DUF4192 domain-containing protein n=1 Tax=Kitasatospora aburaviensis TaxID=67265 RepID=A0ABW1F537_9ACTN|nr:DUF4192 domain-containing protein [Kitasatospora sp. CM 4170]WNM47949.1 DUF4192 domain-containing protein [Kitasatospora sp. CM 4170]